MYSDLDYFVTKAGVVGLVKGSIHSPGAVLGLPVYVPNAHGDRWNRSLGRMKKIVAEPYQGDISGFALSQTAPLAATVKTSEIVKVFRPRAGFQRLLQLEDPGSIWHQLARSLVDLGVPQKSIGVFGSVLVGLDVKDGRRIKDVDFVIYGRDNCRLVRENIGVLRHKVGAGPISPAHISYQARKFSEMGVGAAADLRTTLPNKWSSLEFAPGLVSTLRFVDADSGANPLATSVVGVEQVIGEVTDDLGANFMPRTFSLRTTTGEIVAVASYFWAHQAAIKRGQMVKAVGNRRASDWITLETPGHRLKVTRS